MILSSSSDRIIIPKDKYTVEIIISELINLILSLLAIGSLRDLRNHKRGTSINPWPIINDIKVYVCCGSSGLDRPTPITIAPAKKAEKRDAITIPNAVWMVNVLFIEVRVFIFYL